MSSQSACPDQDVLKSLAAGSLDGPASAHIWRHLVECVVCRTSFERLQNEVTPAPRGSTVGDPLTDSSFDENPPRDERPEISTLDIGFLSPSNDPQVLGRVAQCNVLAPVGRGGMGVVFKAFDTSLHRTVAVKVLSPQLASSPEAKRRFQREARAAAAINHPNVVVIHAVGEQSGTPYLIMEFVAGRTLHDRIRSGRPFDLAAFLRISAQIADGLAAAHRQGVVHRDIKPRNIMLENGVERVKITDFGLALAALDDTQITSMNRVVGTPSYMSPEQVQGARVDRRSDLFSLGCVMHTMVTSRSPFQGAHALEIARKVVELPVPPLHKVAPRIPAVLSGIVSKLLEKDPNRRYQTAEQLHGELQNLLANLSHGKSTISFSSPPLKRFPRRAKRLALAASAALAVAILLALLVPRFWPAPGVSSGPPPSGDVAPSRRIVHVDQDGSADYRTIKEALAHAGSDATIQVLGAGPYHESVALINPANHGVLLEAPAHAVLEVSDVGNPAVVRIEGVSDLKLKGFQIKTTATQFGATVSGRVSGLVLDDISFIQTRETQWAGLFFLNSATGPVIISHCTFRCGQLGLILAGDATGPASQVRVENNRFLAADTHLFLSDAVRNVSITGNVFVKRIGVGVNLLEGVGSREIRVSNNTFVDSTSWMTFEGPALPPGCVISNNLIIRADGINRGNHESGDLLKNWKFHNNYWQPGPHTDAESAALFATVHLDNDLLSLDPESPVFVRPRPGSTLGTAGAGGVEASYVGAFPPAAP